MWAGVIGQLGSCLGQGWGAQREGLDQPDPTLQNWNWGRRPSDLGDLAMVGNPCFGESAAGKEAEPLERTGGSHTESKGSKLPERSMLVRRCACRGRADLKAQHSRREKSE